MKKDYVMTGYYWDENNCQNEVYVLWSQNLSQKKKDELALKEYNKFRQNNPELNVEESVEAFEEYQLKKVNNKED